MLISSPEPLLFDAVAETGLQYSEGMRFIGKINSNGTVVAVLVFELYCGYSVWLHAWFPKRIFYRDLLQAGFDYAYNQLGVTKIFGKLSTKNSSLITYERLGFKHITTIPAVYAPDDGIYIIEATKESMRQTNGRIFFDT